jgi:hypothetical protein
VIDHLNAEPPQVAASAAMHATSDQPAVLDEELGWIVRAALSAVLGDSRCKSATPADQLNHVLRAYARTATKRSPAPAPELAACTFSTGATTMAGSASTAVRSTCCGTRR